MAVITSNSITFIDNTGVEKYLYIRYSDDGVTFTANNGLTPGDWLGTCTTSSITAPTDFNAYKWSKIKGEAAVTYYTWIKYADDSNGTNMSDSPDNKAYIGIAYNKETQTESNIASDYAWSLIKGANGIDGDNGETYYTWIKYADDNIGTGISDDPTGKEYIGIAYNKLTSTESNNPIDYTWSLFKGTDGIDGKNGAAGKGIKSISEYYLISKNNTGVTTSTSGWSTVIPTLDKTNKYLWNYEKTEFTTGEIDTTEPVVIGVYGDGVDSIVNYYAVTSEPTLPDEWIEEMPPAISSTNKYLWNYEKITYTDGNFAETEPAIIGVHGDNGTDAVDFQIYSVDGFEFSDNLASIELKTIAYQAGERIASGLSYKWSWWNKDQYEAISGATSSSLIVSMTDAYAFAELKCEMTYDGIVYEDHVSLTEKTIVYTSVVKFFNGSNTLGKDEDYLVAYIELYKDNQIEETIEINTIWNSENNSVQNGIISTDIFGSYSDGDMMYFVCPVEDEYDVVLGIYNSEQWITCAHEYIYKNDLFANTTSNVFIVPKEKISRTLNINIEVCTKDESIIARTNANVIDLKDPIVNSIAPSDPKEGQLWLDTSISPSILKMWDGNEWVNSGYQNGGSVYTSQPNKYYAGDLWILADNEECGEFGSGSMLKAISTSSSFNESHWIDATDGIFTIITNVRESFTWDASGIQIARKVTDSSGNVSTPFYVHIDSTRMGFHSRTESNGQVNDVEVVHIGNNSATIQNATFEGNNGTIVNNDLIANGNATFNNSINMYNPDVTGGFVWQVEDDGSFSLALAN